MPTRSLVDYVEENGESLKEFKQARGTNVSADLGQSTDCDVENQLARALLSCRAPAALEEDHSSVPKYQ